MSANSGERVFTSWKEIASFFGKGVRTVQRWERKFGLPISRPTAAKNVVLATERELRDWIRKSSSQLEHEDDSNQGSSNSDGDSALNLTQFSVRLKRLEDDTARLANLISTFSKRLDEVTLPVVANQKKLLKGRQASKNLSARPNGIARI
jgi:phage terminase Nu1 subunit (DNA packaging protein)